MTELEREKPKSQKGPVFDFDAVFHPENYLYFYEDTLTEERTLKEVDFLVRELALDSPKRILDLACGHGRHANRLAERGHSVVGLDRGRRFLEIAEEDVAEAIPKLSELIKSQNPLTISFELPLYFICKYVREENVITGQGADELFGGYARYLKMKPEAAQEWMKKDVNRLADMGIHREISIARYFSKTLICPYLEDGIVDLA